MHFRYLLSDPHGDIELTPDDLEQPFLVSPEEQHPFLTLADYFGALQRFIMSCDGEVFQKAFQKKGLSKDISLSGFTEILIRSEKHGAFYHIASVEIIALGENGKFAVTTALSESAKESLVEEFIILQKLTETSGDFLPEFYCQATIEWEAQSGSENFLMILGEWFDGYNEWHVSDDPETAERKIHLWDYENGYRFLSDAESYELLRQAAYILTFYYEQESFCQIYPWHHGAGDFVVKAELGGLSVKLITARQYEPLVHFDEAEEADRLIAAIHFLLNLVLRMRLDRVDGVGEPAWLGAFAIQAAADGFFAGLGATQENDRLMIGPATEFLEIMQSFDTREIYDMYASLLEIYAEEDRDDFSLIQEKLADHAVELHEVLQEFSLKTS
jgi:hypothetical protein